MGSNPRLLITGASGQLGSYLLREAIQQGMTIVAWSGSRSGDQFGVPFVPVDVADAAAVGEAFRSARPTMIIHAGAVASVAACWSDLERAHQVNAQGT